jgi:hypothetical protein
VLVQRRKGRFAQPRPLVFSASPRRHLINALLSATALAGAGSLLPSGPAHAQTQWTGNTSTDWFTAGNWNPAAVPGAATDVQINNGAVPNPANMTAAGATAAASSWAPRSASPAR